MKKRAGDFPFSSPPRARSPPLFGGAFFLGRRRKNDLQAFWERLEGRADIFPSGRLIERGGPFAWLVGALGESARE